MFILDGQPDLQGWSRRRAPRHSRASPRRQRRLLGVESLESRCVLSASHFGMVPQTTAIHEVPAAVPVPAVTVIKSVSIVETANHGPAVEVTAEVVPLGMSNEPAEGNAFAGSGRLRSTNELGAFDELNAPAGAGLASPLPVTLIGRPAPLLPLDAPPGAPRITPSSLSMANAPADSAPRDRPPPLLMTLADSRATDNSSIRVLIWMSQMTPLGGIGEQGYGQFDLRGRFADFVHDSLLSVRPSSLEGPHSATDRTSGEDEVLEEGSRHAANPALFGQNAETGSLLARGARSMGEMLESFDLEADGRETLDHQAVGSLVGLGDAAAIWAAAIWGSRAAGGEGNGSTVDFVLHELLAPRFPFDSAALGDAIRELIAETDELGTSLLGFLADTTQQGEMTLVAGVAAGLAYHHWRGRERRAQAESRAMLAARFVTGPTSVRLNKRDPA